MNLCFIGCPSPALRRSFWHTVTQETRLTVLGENRPSAREFEAVAEKKRKEKEFEEHQRKRQLEKHGPRSEEDALAKAMDSLKFGGLE